MSDIRVDEAGDGRYVTVAIKNPVFTETAMPDSITLTFTNDEAADLLSKLRAQIGEWAAERDAAQKAVRGGVTLDEYVGRSARDAWDAIVEAGDLDRKAEKENR